MSQLYTVVIGISIVNCQVSLVVGVATHLRISVSLLYNIHLQTVYMDQVKSIERQRNTAFNKQLTIGNNDISGNIIKNKQLQTGVK